MPFIVLALVVFHILALHNEGSSSPHLNNHGTENISFGTYYVLKDLLGVLSFFLAFLAFLVFAPNALNHPDNYIPANPMQTPPHIVPEWYFLPFYAILRTIPSKGLGVVAMGASILFLVLLPSVTTRDDITGAATPSVIHLLTFWVFAITTVLLGFLGGQPISYPYTDLSLILTFVYFSYTPFLSFWTAYANNNISSFCRNRENVESMYF